MSDPERGVDYSHCLLLLVKVNYSRIPSPHNKWGAAAEERIIQLHLRSLRECQKFKSTI